MQVNVKTEQKKFQPVQLNITFETEQELHSFMNLAGRNATVSQCVRDSLAKIGTIDCAPNFDQYVLSDILGKMYRELNQLNE